MTDSLCTTPPRTAADPTSRDADGSPLAAAVRNRVLLTIVGGVASFAAFFFVSNETFTSLEQRTLPYGEAATPEAVSATVTAALDYPRGLLGAALLIAAAAWLLMTGSRAQWARALMLGGTACAVLPGAVIGSVALFGLAGWILHLESRPGANPA